MRSVLRCTVHCALPGTMNTAYEPAFTAAPPNVKSLLAVSFVAWFAPARQTLSYGTRSPQIFRFFTAGLEYSSAKSVTPTRCSSFARWLSWGRSTNWAAATEGTRQHNRATDRLRMRPTTAVVAGKFQPRHVYSSCRMRRSLDQLRQPRE